MAAIPYFMDYVIFFQDAGEYALATAIAGGNLLKMAPRDAATLFNIPFPYPSGDMSSIPRGIYFLFPYTVGQEIKFPGPSGVFIDDTILTVTVAGQAGNPASVWPAGPSATFTWSGNIVKNGKGAQTNPAPPAMSQRRWIGGKEIAESAQNPNTNTYGRDASRTIDGFGSMIRGNSLATPWTRNVNEFRTGLITTNSWERFYLRLRKAPTTNDVGFWDCISFPSAGCGCALLMRTNGNIEVYDSDSSGILTSKGVLLTPAINTWYRIDILLNYTTGGITAGGVNIYVNGVFALGYFTTTGGMGSGSRHISSRLGYWTGLVDNEIEMDFDDWINADLPANCNASSLAFNDSNFPLDWLCGSHVRVHFSVTASQVNWTPAGSGVGVQNQGRTPINRLGTSELASSSSASSLEGTTDALLKSVPDSLANVLGAVAAIVTLYSRNAANTDGQLGYRVAGGSATMVTIDQVSADGYNYAAYLPSGIAAPTEISPWVVVHTKSADANADATSMLMSVVEYIGVWGKEDDPRFAYPISRLSNLHNCLYPNTAWGYLGSQPAAPQYSIGGTYVGNGTYQEFTLPAACHFLKIRSTSVANAGAWLTGAAFGAHFGTTARVIPNVRMWFDFANNVFKFSVTGAAGSNVNVNGETYQYIAFCDPGMRFSVCGQFSHGNSSATPKSNTLITPDFVPTIGFFQNEDASFPSTAAGLFFKGPNNAANSAYDAQNTNTNATVANYPSAGQLNSFATLHNNNGGDCAYMLWRTQDSGPDGCSSNVVIQVTSYIGNNVNPRAVPLTPASGRFPLLTIVYPTSGSGQGHYRDPSHAGTNSSQLSDGTVNGSGIVSVGIDTISVQSVLNLNGVTYQVFTICGDSAGNNNGTFFSTYCGGDGPYIPPSTPSTEPNILGNGGLILGGAVPFTIIKDASGIYTLVPGKTHDTLIDRNTTPSTSLNVKIPNPTWKTGYLGG